MRTARSESEVSQPLSSLGVFPFLIILEKFDKKYKCFELDEFGETIQNKTLLLSKITDKKKKLTLTVAVNYGGKQEILKAVQNCLNDGIKHLNSLKDFERYLFNFNSPGIDLLIRTGGEKRLSNFTLWHLAYTELIFIDQMWPDFNNLILDKCIHTFNKRVRNYGV